MAPSGALDFVESFPKVVVVFFSIVIPQMFSSATFVFTLIVLFAVDLDLVFIAEPRMGIMN